MTKQSKTQKEIIGRVMHEFKHGALKVRGGRKVKNPKQAIAIGLRAAGASREQSPQEKKRSLARTKQRKLKIQTATKQPK
jgi:hypothetical protein